MKLNSVRIQSSLVFAFATVCSVHGALVFQNPSALPDDVQYDFIIAGGGTGGAVVAARLGENPDWKVLVIEAGPSNDDVFIIRPPGLCHELTKTTIDWNYTLTPQAGLNGRSSEYARGRLLGGCSSHNGMAYTRGSRDDWDRWAKVTGEEALSWDNMLPFMFEAETLMIEDSEKQSEAGHIDPSLHSRKGKVSVTAPYSNHPMNDMLIQTTKELTEEFPFKLDMNDGRPIGIAWNQFTIDQNAERSSSATAYLAKTNSNVHVLVNTYVIRVLPTQGHGGTEFRGIEFASDAQSERRQLVAKKEVIVSGGVIGTPQILLNSGIGKREELEAFGVKALVDNPSVGKNLTDQVSTLVMLPTTIPNTDYDRDTALAEWNQTRTGPMVLPGHLNHIIYVRLPGDIVSQLGFADPSPGDNSPHIEFVFSQISANPPVTTADGPPPPTGAGVTIQTFAVNLHPISRGSITLNSSNPFDHPTVDFQMLSNDADIAILREGIRSARRMYSAPVFSDSVFQTLLPAANATTDEELDVYIRNMATPFLHGVGSAAMSPFDASWGVVNPDFRVKGTSGLRVVDASVFPYPPSGHTQVPVYGFAERASMLIAKSWK